MSGEVDVWLEHEQRASRWHRALEVACSSLVASVVIMMIWSPFAFVAAGTALYVLFVVYKAGSAVFGPHYALRHLLLAVLLTPMCGLGLLLVPLLVRSDIVKHRSAIRPGGFHQSERTCPHCGYDRIGNMAAGCPECGWGRKDHGN